MTKHVQEQFSEFLQALSVPELTMLRSHMNTGIVQEHISRRIHELESPAKVCPMCEVALTKSHEFELQFGPHDFRQRARFCGQDCLQQFLHERAGK